MQPWILLCSFQFILLLHQQRHAGVHAFQLLPHLRFDPLRAEKLDPEYSWVNRQTGVQSQWTSGIGFWQHYDVTTIAAQLRAGEAAGSNDQEQQEQSRKSIVPFTQGYMRKHLRQVNDTAFELWSVYQPSAVGHWLTGLMSHSRHDHNWDHSYLFSQTPYRINHNPLPNLPDGSTTRVFLVKPGSATLHGTMHLPTVAETEAHKGPNWQFFELWLAEEYPLGDGMIKEGRKVGAVVEFHGLSGCLNQVFQIHEMAEGVAEQHPKDDINFDETALAPIFPTQTDRPHNFCSTAGNADAGQDRPWASTRVIHLVDGHMDPEYATDVEGPLQETGVLDPSVFHTIPLQNGAYLKIPKCFDATLNGEVCLEFGCRRLDGDCHRLVVYGDRAQGGCYHTICYDRWRDA